MKRLLVGSMGLAGLLSVLGAGMAPAANAQAANRPIVAIWYFDNNTVGPTRGDYEGIQKGIAELLITDFAAAGRVRVVERGRIDDIMKEQNLTRSGAVDPATALRLSRVLQACYSVMGGLQSDGRNVVLTGRIQDLATTEVDPRTIRVTRSNLDDLMGMITELSTKLAAQINLAACPGTPSRGDAAPAQLGGVVGQASSPGASGTPAVEQFAKTLPPEKLEATRKVKLDWPTAKIYSNALDALDAKDKNKAAALFQQVLDKYKDFAPAADGLAKARTGI